MKKVRDVYQKLREVKYHHLVKMYKFLLKRVPDNCRYNYPYFLKKDKCSTTINLCFLHQPEENIPKPRLIWPISYPEDIKINPQLLDICKEVHHCSLCNAYIPRYTKEEISKKFEENLKDIKYKEKYYPDICALEWVLEQSVLGMPPFNWFQKIYFFTKKKLSKNRVL